MMLITTAAIGPLFLFWGIGLISMFLLAAGTLVRFLVVVAIFF